MYILHTCVCQKISCYPVMFFHDFHNNEKTAKRSNDPKRNRWISLPKSKAIPQDKAKLKVGSI